MSYVFGPVPSRRLGLSLGIDLIPAKTCTYDCLYCQVGRTTLRTLEARPFIPLSKVVAELEKKLRNTFPDVVTLAGSGEPTLHSQIDQMIAAIKKRTETKVAVLTNGSLFWREDVRKGVLKADIILPTLSSAFANTFRTIHRPHPELNLDIIVEGLKRLRKDFRGQLFLEVVILSGINDGEREVEGIKTLIDQIAPEKTQINTVVRPPADSRAVPLERKKMEEIRDYFGKNAEIVAESPVDGRAGERDALARGFLDMVKRRPLRPVDISHSMGLSMDAVDTLVKGLLMKGYICKQEHGGEVYFRSTTDKIE
jgi:wyosine [tRNA(Phe)-imidazoG37] synthetase (radical SAM superfamily)